MIVKTEKTKNSLGWDVTTEHFDNGLYNEIVATVERPGYTNVWGKYRKGYKTTTREAGIEYGPRKVISVALEHANMVREALAIGEGKLPKLPKAIPGDPRHCVLAKALSNGWIPNVDAERIRLSHPVDGSVDFRKAKEALVALGFQNVKATTGTKNGSVSFRTTTAMAQLIEAFDRDEIPWLILEGHK